MKNFNLKRNFDFESAIGFCAVVMQRSTRTKHGLLLYIDSSQGSFYQTFINLTWHSIEIRLRDGIVTIFFIKFRWGDQKRHSRPIERGMVSRYDCSADISIAFIAISQCQNNDIIDSATVFIVPLFSR